MFRQCYAFSGQILRINVSGICFQNHVIFELLYVFALSVDKMQRK